MTEQADVNTHRFRQQNNSCRDDKLGAAMERLVVKVNAANS
jgi:hypothetical protein